MIAPQTEIIVSKDGVELARRTVAPGEYVFGREGDADFRLETPLASRHHARLYVNYDEWLIEDLASANGTFINDRRVAPNETTRIFPTQTLRVGDATVTLRRVRGSEAPEASLPPAVAAGRTLLPEEVRARRYAIGQVVAQGGMGAILSAEDQAIRRSVAMKVMLQSGDAGDLARFVEEAQITGQLEHPNIVPVHELGVDEQDQFFYTMKFVRGITLRKILELISSVEATARKYPLGGLLTIFQKVCDAVAFAHSRGVIHRDLKPENIMLGDFGEVLVMDWGLAKSLGGTRSGASQTSDGGPGDRGRAGARPSEESGATLAGTIMGTPQYMAPEQARGEVGTMDQRADIDALGAILFHLLALRPSVTGHDPMAIVGKVARGEIEPLSPSSKSRPIPDSLAAVCRKAMALDPAARYPSVPALQAEIEAFQNGFATGAEKAGAWKQFTLFVKRNKAASIGVAAALVLTTGFTAKVVHEGRRATAALARLRGTAPTFAAQAAALIENNKFDEALDKIGFAIELDGTNADFHLFRANTLQATARLPEAIQSYRRVLALRDDAAAKTNLDLCEKLRSENGGDSALALPLKSKLLDAILAQKRQADAVPLSRELKRDSDTAETLIKSRLRAIFAQPGWTWQKLVRQPNGTFRLDLRDQKVPDLGILAGLPISELNISGFQGVDLTPLRQVPLRILSLNGCKRISIEGLRGMKLTTLELSGSDVSDLSPLAGMPLERLSLAACPLTNLTPLHGMPLQHLDLTYVGGVTDPTPLRGMPLRTLYWKNTSIRNLTALRGAPLEVLSIPASAVETLDGIQGAPLRVLAAYEGRLADISALRGLPVVDVDLGGSPVRDLTPLAECQKIERLLVATQTSDIAFLKKLPNLKRIGFGSILRYTDQWGRVPTAEDFWKKNGDRLARQVPMEKQLEKFRQSLIAQGNDPENVPRWSFDAEGQLQVGLGKELKVSDISELRGVAVTKFTAYQSSLRDLSPLAGAPLREITLYPPCGVTDISPLRDAPLEVLYLDVVPVRDISVVRKMPLRMAYLKDCPIADVSPLADVPTLETVLLPPAAKNVETLRKHPKIAMISYVWDVARKCPNRTAAEFWKEFDAKKAAGK